ncbi:MAG: sulfatase/phosphatase domain-containing protein, partial [Limisphaerales bacterium]
PHVPCVATKKYFDLYPLDKIKAVNYPPEHLEKIPKMAFGDRMESYRALTEQQQKKFIQAYLASVSFMDAQFGKVLNAVDHLKLANDTIVVFASDHGWHLGEHGLWQKQSLFEESARVPLMIRVPGPKGNGKRVSRPVELLDIYPTVVEAAGFTVLPELEGKSLKPLLQNPKADWNRPAFTQVGTANSNRQGRSVRTDRWTYIEWFGGEHGTQLYDYKADPKELNNLASDPKHAATIAELKTFLPSTGSAPTKDRGGRNRRQAGSE